MLTSTQLIRQVSQICKAPGMIQQIGVFLNTVLEDIALTYDLEVTKLTTTITTGISAISYALPNNYLRLIELFYYISGEPFFLSQMPQYQYDQLFQGPGISDFPRWWASDLGETNTPPGQPGYAPKLYMWPPPSVVLACTLRYRALPLPITNPESSSVVPWFPDQRFLMKRLCADTMMITGDKRMTTFGTDADKILQTYAQNMDDKSGYAQQVKLDPRAFRLGGASKATKLLPL